MDKEIAIVGLGYVGLPLAVSLGQNLKVTGLDKSPGKIDELKRFVDPNGEVSSEELSQANGLKFSCDIMETVSATVYIICVPTPVDEHKVPDLRLLRSACSDISKVLRKGDLVIIESTVFPGVTEEICKPILIDGSGIDDFELGYSPERINPGDASHSLKNVTKVIAGSSTRAVKRMKALYSLAVSAPLYEAKSIKIAEASKVIENCQRDINIAFMNELAVLFNKIGLSTKDVLDAASTKWNFLPFTPGLVGGHCIGVDPYYLTHLAVKHNYHPEIILAGRRINDSMGEYIAQKVVNKLAQNKLGKDPRSVLLVGATFKENCSDVRNSRCEDIARFLKSNSIVVSVYDPNVSHHDISHWGVESVSRISGLYDSIIYAVPHNNIAKDIYELIERSCLKSGFVFDVKSQLSEQEIKTRGFEYEAL